MNMPWPLSLSHLVRIHGHPFVIFNLAYVWRIILVFIPDLSFLTAQGLWVGPKS